MGARQADTYANFADLKAHEKYGLNYSISVTDRSAPVTVYAIHGHFIDLNTELIAQPLAGEDWNLYQFLGDSFRLHVTATHFDEPQAVALAARSKICVSIHGHFNDAPRICIGGADKKFRAKFMSFMQEAGLPIQLEMLCKGLEGTGSTNIVNECRGPGLQLEFSSELRKRLFSNPTLFQQTIRAIRRSVLAAI